MKGVLVGLVCGAALMFALAVVVEYSHEMLEPGGGR